MPRPKKPSTLIPPGWRSALKDKFLGYAFQAEPAALRELATEVKEGKITARQWAQNLGVLALGSNRGPKLLWHIGADTLSMAPAAL